ncbi:hypothetical protein HNQ94_003424 [Salirhabdus euzebyi]|uniref:HTH arsR-type domain-containing protein n=1 Tax=Salirhabdus euzebyi TaxID=394506 RepID=A0A841Q986_9BACI|nr:winged helix-turn-helix domain-containing protein [Salirhabdus euzebyi]MBB6454935.1 hypothetical protein [Salirhabdus euzebyi]
MNFHIHLKYSPIHELIISFLLYKRQSKLKYINVGKEWTHEIREKVSSSLLNKIDNLTDLQLFDLLDVLVESTDESSSIEEVLQSIQQQTPGELYEQLAPSLMDNESLPNNLAEARDELVEILSGWHTQYFSNKEGDISHKLLGELAKAKLLAVENNKEELLDALTNGVKLETEAFKDVYLIPTYHFKPLATYHTVRGKLYCLFPEQPDNTTRLLSVGKAISDQKRVDILQLLLHKKLTFTEIAKCIGGSKGNVHHHLMILRSAGLLHTHFTNQDGPFVFSTRTTPLRHIESCLI